MLRKVSYNFSILMCLVAVLGASMLLVQPVSGRIELVLNGGFEEGWQGWEKYSLGRGYASLDPVDPYEGLYSLSIQGTPTPQVGAVYGSGVYQTIERTGLPLDLEFEFWVKPWASGKGIVEIKAIATLHVTHQTTGSKILKIVYYVAWRSEAESWANIREDEADYFVDAFIHTWNHFRTDLKYDFEDRWGASTGYSATKIILTFEIAVQYPATNTEYANWDGITFSAPEMTSTQASTILTTESTTSLSTKSTTTETPVTTRAALTTKTTDGGASLLTRPELVASVIMIGVLAVSVVAIALRRRRLVVRRAAPGRPAVSYCINCGAPNPASAMYCSKCGTRIEPDISQ